MVEVHPQEVTAFLHGEIPITRAMGIEAASWDGRTIMLTAPLKPNENHADTAFGGSIATLGIMSGYCLLHVLMKERQLSTRILIQKSTTEYLRPIDEAMTATATCPEPEVLREHLEKLTRKRRVRMEITSRVLCRQTVAATHTGVYVVMVY